jgi:hypothetical protein
MPGIDRTKGVPNQALEFDWESTGNLTAIQIPGNVTLLEV